MWNLKYGTDDPIHKTETDHRHGEHTCGCGGGVGEGGGWMGNLGLVDTNCNFWNGQWVPIVQHRELCVIGSLCGTRETEETL